MRPSAAVATFGVLLLAGCGQASTGASGFEGEEKGVAQAVADLADNAQRGEAATICSQVLAARLRDQIAEPGSSCAQEMEKTLDDADGFDLEVTDVAVQGGEATAKVSAGERGKEVVRTFRLVREAGDWRVLAFA